MATSAQHATGRDYLKTLRSQSTGSTDRFDGRDFLAEVVIVCIVPKVRPVTPRYAFGEKTARSLLQRVDSCAELEAAVKLA